MSETKGNIKENIKLFETTLLQTQRSNMDSLIKYIRTTDFYTAPASTQYHSAYEGGLLQHSLNVYYALSAKIDQSPWRLKNFKEDSVAIVALLHDICKADFYTTDYKNQKVYSENGKKQDAKGNFDWQTVPYYKVDDQLPYGHGEKSVYIINSFIKLSREEAMAIRWHMGFSEPKEAWKTLGEAFEKYPLALALHHSDMEATYLYETENL